MPQDHLPALEGLTLSGRPVHFPKELPESGLVLVIGFSHGARHDVGAWKRAFAEQGIPFLSLPTAAMDTQAEALRGVAQAMRAFVPREGWEDVVQIHRGGESLREAFGWEADGCAKVVRVTDQGQVLARHDMGPFTKEALAAFLG